MRCLKQHKPSKMNEFFRRISYPINYCESESEGSLVSEFFLDVSASLPALSITGALSLSSEFDFSDLEEFFSISFFSSGSLLESSTSEGLGSLDFISSSIVLSSAFDLVDFVLAELLFFFAFFF